MHHALEGIFIKGVDIAINDFDCVSVSHVIRHGFSKLINLSYIWALYVELALTDEKFFVQNIVLDLRSFLYKLFLQYIEFSTIVFEFQLFPLKFLDLLLNFTKSWLVASLHKVEEIVDFFTIFPNEGFIEFFEKSVWLVFLELTHFPLQIGLIFNKSLLLSFRLDLFELKLNFL